MCPSNTIDTRDLPAAVSAASGDSGAPPIPGSTLADIERYAILETLESTGGSTSRAAEILGVSVRKIQYKLHAYAEAPKEDIAAVEDTAEAAAEAK
jgi:two-component system response regulator HydG